jgi:acetyltransferase
MRPYPTYLVRSVTLADGASLVIRPITPEDADIEQEFVRNLSAEARYFRFMDALRELSPQMLSHFTQVDYDRHMALVAVSLNERETEVAVARYIVSPDDRGCEFAIVVADAWQRRGVGRLLMEALMDAACRRGLKSMFGEVLASNHKMLALVSRLGFRVIRSASDPRVVRIQAALEEGTGRA